MSIVRKISRDVLSDALLEEIDKKLSEDEKLSYNNLLDKPFIPEPITEVPETLLSIELQEKINNMMPADATVDWSKVTNAPDFSTLDLEDVQSYVVPEIDSLREEIYGKIDAGASVLTKEDVLALVQNSIGTTELTTDLLAIINNKMNKGAGISYSQILDPPAIPEVTVVDYDNLTPDLQNRIDEKISRIDPKTSGVFYHKGNGPGSTDIIFKIQSNNGTLNGSSDASSNFHFGGVDVVFDTNVSLNGSIVSPNNTMTESEATTGTATTERLVTASVLKKAIETHAPTIHTSEATPTNNAEIWYKIIE